MPANFIRYGGEPTEPPNRIYARIDRLELEFPDPSEPITTTFDGVDANQFDSLRQNLRIDQARLSVLEVEFFDPSMRHIPVGQEGEEPGDWFEIRITSSRTPIRARQYTNLFGAPLLRFIEDKIRIITDQDLQNDLNNAVLFEQPETPEPIILDVLNRRQRIIGAGVYDVGQGACQAFLGEGGLPVLYFDLGGGVLNNRRTFPEALTNFCTTLKPPVILSHLDWDHWSSAQRFTDLLGMTWIIPNQEMGFTQKAFLTNIIDHGGQVLVWPSALMAVQVPQLRVEKCTGRGRNHSGLAVVLESPDRRERMLFTGDARYNVIPSAQTQDFLAVVAPHHGGDIRNNYVPARMRAPSDRLVLSYGEGNSYGHPAPITFKRHSGWTDFRTADRLPDVGGGADEPGHVGLFWAGIPPVPNPPCGGRCSMKLLQV